MTVPLLYLKYKIRVEEKQNHVKSFTKQKPLLNPLKMKIDQNSVQESFFKNQLSGSKFCISSTYNVKSN
jgi:hypothetical protein